MALPGNLTLTGSLFLLFLLLIPTPALGGEGVYQPLVGIPGLDNPAENFGAYLNQLYFLSISIAALIAVVKIIIAGVKWMMTDLISGKSEAAGEIRASLLGLLLIVSAVLILETINPQLTNFNVLRFATPARVPTISATPPATPRTITPSQTTTSPDNPGVEIHRPTTERVVGGVRQPGAFVPADVRGLTHTCTTAVAGGRPAGTVSYTIRECKAPRVGAAIECKTETTATPPRAVDGLKEVLEITCTRPTQ